MNTKTWLRAGTATLLLALPLPALAQASQDDPAEIIVTAQKREERLIDVPQSITAVSADDLARLNATQFRDFADSVPGLTFTSSGVGQNQVSLRGVTSGVDVGATVGIYVDDVPYGSSSSFANGASLGLDAGLFDLERVEVLRGPQGTLYGASAMGGVLKYIIPEPSLDAFEVKGQGGLSFTRYGGTNYNGAVALTGPLVTDKIGVRASGFYSRDGGFIRNVDLGEDNIGRSRVYGGRLDVLFQPTEALSFRLSGYAQNISRFGTSAADYSLAGVPADGALDQRRRLDEPFDQEFRLVSGTLGYDFGGAVLTSITSYQTNETAYRADASQVYVDVLAAALGLDFSATEVVQFRATDKFTQEVRLASAGEGTIDWLLGGFYTKEKSRNRQQIVGYELTGEVSPIDIATIALPSDYEEVAGFGNVTVHLSEAFDVTGGLRVAHNKQRFTQIGSGLLVGSTPTQTASETVVTYLANARYRFSPHATAYARFATGYRPGGPNFVARDPFTGELLAPPTFDADTLHSYEVGFKGETADRTFSIDVAGYHIDWKDMQVLTGAGGITVLANANSAKIDGVELTLGARPSPEFTVTGAFAYQNARLGEDSPQLNAVKGERLPNVPKFTAAINADYQASGDGVRPLVGATLRFVSDRQSYFKANPTLPQFDLGDYVTLDLRAGASLGPVDLQFFVRNLFDNRGFLSADTSSAITGGPARVTIIQPRTIGLSATARF